MSRLKFYTCSECSEGDEDDCILMVAEEANDPDFCPFDCDGEAHWHRKRDWKPGKKTKKRRKSP